MTRLEKYGIPLALAANVAARLIATRRTTADLHPSSMIVILGGSLIAALAMVIVLLEHRAKARRALG